MSYEHRNRPRRVSVVEYRSVESKGLWFDIPYGDLEFFPLPHARDKTKKKSSSSFVLVTDFGFHL